MASPPSSINDGQQKLLIEVCDSRGSRERIVLVDVQPNETLRGLREVIADQLDEHVVPRNYFFQYHEKDMNAYADISRKQEGKLALGLPKLRVLPDSKTRAREEEEEVAVRNGRAARSRLVVGTVGVSSPEECKSIPNRSRFSKWHGKTKKSATIDLTEDDTDDDAMEQATSPMKTEPRDEAGQEEHVPSPFIPPPVSSASPGPEACASSPANGAPANTSSTSSNKRNVKEDSGLSSEGGQKEQALPTSARVDAISNYSLRANDAPVAPPPYETSGTVAGETGQPLDNHDATNPPEGPLDPKVKEEMTRKESKKKRENVYRKYADRYLLARQAKNGIARLGGSWQDTYPCPGKGNHNIWDHEKQCLKEGYPFPKFLEIDPEVEPNDWGVFGYAAYNNEWNINAPKYAGQPFAAVSGIPEYFLDTGHPFPIFVGRKKINPGCKNGKLLGWEYVGNYKASTPNEVESFWESAGNYSQGSKDLIARKTLKSSKSDGGYGRRTLDYWRKKLSLEMEKDNSPAAPAYMVEQREPTEDEKREPVPSLAARARALNFVPNMADEDLAKIMVNLDEEHRQWAITFVEYDERIYEYCKGGKTNHDRMGDLCRDTKRPSAKAGDWYDFAEEKMLMT